MARYHYQTRRDAERQYPHRVDIPVPELGLGKQLNDMIEWCSERFTEWTHAGITDKARRDARGIPMDFVRFYFMDEIAAQEFRERWAVPTQTCSLGVIAVTPVQPVTSYYMPVPVSVDPRKGE